MTKPHLAEVVTLYAENASDVPAMLRQSAENIATETEADDRTVAMIAVQVTESGGIEVYGWGQTDSLKAIGALQLGIAKLARNHFGEAE